MEEGKGYGEKDSIYTEMNHNEEINNDCERCKIDKNKINEYKNILKSYKLKLSALLSAVK